MKKFLALLVFALATISLSAQTVTVYKGGVQVSKVVDADSIVFKSNAPDFIILSADSIAIYVGETAKLNAQLSSGTATTFLWGSSNNAVATVTDGTITALAEGTTVITVATIEGLKATCVVAVTRKYVNATIREAIDIINALDSGASTSAYYRFKDVKVNQNLTDPSKVPGTYTNVNLTVTDGDTTIGCYFMNYIGDVAFTSQDQVPLAGSTVTIVGKLKNYVSKDRTKLTPEMTDGYFEAITPYTPQTFTATVAEAITIANNLAAGAQTVDNYQVSGVIAALSGKTQTDIDSDIATFGDCSFYLKEGNDSIKVFYCTASAGEVVIGESITVLGPIMNYQGTTPEIYKPTIVKKED